MYAQTDWSYRAIKCNYKVTQDSTFNVIRTPAEHCEIADASGPLIYSSVVINHVAFQR